MWAADLTAADAAITSESNTIVESVANCLPRTAADSEKFVSSCGELSLGDCVRRETSEKLASASSHPAASQDTQMNLVDL